MTTQPPDPPSPQPDATRTATDTAHSGRTMGPYRLLQSLGEGGMGEVWLAEQTDPVHRQVAFKVIKAGMDTKQVVARFEAERQALALMDHPAIATVFDGGSTPEGRPYFAMEYVKGEPITTYCDRQRLSTAERLELFIQVCEGVQHAHQKGIIHRDLKPSNVLVMIQDDHPVPKIIDFGVAKAVAQPLTERSLFTELGVLIGTPEYMSPEQAEMSGLDIDTRTDVYALGVMLYELLTGALPFDGKTLREAGLDEVRRTIREKTPPKPSTRVTQLGPASTEAAANRHTEPARLASQLRGDLDWITLKALEKDRTRRYATANALAADVRRHLNHEPVSAGPPNAVYRARKFVRRHQVGVGAAAALVVVLVAFAATMAVQAQRIARERDRANREAETARQVSSFLVGLFEVSKPSEAAANSITAREILDRGADRIRGQLHDQPATRGVLLATMGEVYSTVGLYAKAQSLHEEALTLRRRIAPHSAEAAASLAQLARVLVDQGRRQEAEPMARDALMQRRSLFGQEHIDVADSLALLGSILVQRAEYAEGEAMQREALQMRRKLLGDADVRIARSLAGLGGTAYRKGDYLEMERLFREAHEIDRRALGAGHPTTVADSDNVAGALLLRGKPADAEVVYRDNLAQTLRSLGPGHPELNVAYSNLGAALYLQQKYGEAEGMYREALAIARRSWQGDHPDVAVCISNLGQALDAQGKYSEAEDQLREALEMDRRLRGPDHPQVATVATWLSVVLRHTGRAVEAEALAAEALTINTKHVGTEHPRTREAQGALGMALSQQGRSSEAEPLLLAYAVALESKSGVEGNLGEVVQQIVKMYAAWGKPEKAAEWRKKLPPDSGTR